MVTKIIGKYIVTGASSGIGQDVTKRLLQLGYDVIGISRSINDSKIKHSHFKAVQCDLTDLGKTKQCLLPIVKDESIQGAVCCAGVGYFGGLEQLNFDRVQKMMHLNLLSPMLLSKLLVPQLKQRQSGRLIFIGSEAALSGSKNGTAYCASKFGLRGFVQALSDECKRSGVQVSLINPGMVDTPFFDELAFKPGADKSNSIDVSMIGESVAFILKTDTNMLIDEINLSPRNKVIIFDD